MPCGLATLISVPSGPDQSSQAPVTRTLCRSPSLIALLRKRRCTFRFRFRPDQSWTPQTAATQRRRDESCKYSSGRSKVSPPCREMFSWEDSGSKSNRDLDRLTYKREWKFCYLRPEVTVVASPLEGQWHRSFPWENKFPPAQST